MKKIAEHRRHYLSIDPNDGKAVVFVPMQRGRGCARLFEEDFKRLMDAGLTPYWSYISNGYGDFYVRASLGGGRRGAQVSLARIVVGAKRGQRVRYRDRDPKNLRSDNLYIERGYARRHDSALVIVPTSLSGDEPVSGEKVPARKIVARAPSAPFTLP